MVVTRSPAGTAPRDDRGRPAATRPAREARDRDAHGETQVAERRGSSQFHSVKGVRADYSRESLAHDDIAERRKGTLEGGRSS